ncbi:MAG: hypothetical protein IJP24_01070 [Firmicutes bacterium]|nr:hypothetical protein [Bacillota bacterium]MBQ3123441.1 hypothetical protein [Bacillota bacterium]MBQ9972086.1 hypothetical protein [Bacillota bacterium]
MNPLPLLLVLALTNSSGKNPVHINSLQPRNLSLSSIPDTQEIIIKMRQALETLERIEQMKNMARTLPGITGALTRSENTQYLPQPSESSEGLPDISNLMETFGPILSSIAGNNQK